MPSPPVIKPHSEYHELVARLLNGVRTRLAERLQSGYVFTYAFAMVLGILVLVTWMTLVGG